MLSFEVIFCSVQSYSFLKEKIYQFHEAPKFLFLEHHELRWSSCIEQEVSSYCNIKYRIAASRYNFFCFWSIMNFDEVHDTPKTLFLEHHELRWSSCIKHEEVSSYFNIKYRIAAVSSKNFVFGASWTLMKFMYRTLSIESLQKAPNFSFYVLLNKFTFFPSSLVETCGDVVVKEAANLSGLLICRLEPSISSYFYINSLNRLWLKGGIYLMGSGA